MAYKNKEDAKRWRENNKERKSLLDKRYREANKEKIAEQKRLWNIEHNEEQLKKKKLYRETHQEEIKASRKRYKKENKNKLTERGKKYYKENKEVLNEKNKKYRDAHKVELNIRGKESYRKNPEKWINNTSRRRAIKKVTDITTEWLRNLYKKAKNCPICNVELNKVKCNSYPNGSHLDHIIPLNVGGLHMMDNVRIICFKCNMKRPKDGSDVIKQ